VAVVTRITGDLQLAEEAAQEACAVALSRWPVDGMPSSPASWLAGTARHKALDILRRDRRRPDLELEAALGGVSPVGPVADVDGDDRLGLIFLCCHPALDLDSRLALTLRSVAGLPTEAIAALFLVSRATVAQRLVRAKRKIRAARISFRTPDPVGTAERLGDVLEVVRLIFTHGYRHPGPGDRACEEAIRLARLVYQLVPGDAEAGGLLALLLLTDARRAGRVDRDGAAVTLAEQDRSLWASEQIREGQTVLDEAIRNGQPGRYQIEAAIASLHSGIDDQASTDWPQIALLYGELLRYTPSPVVEANRAVAVAMAEGPGAGLAILDDLANQPMIETWPQLHVARGALLAQLGRNREAIAEYREALDLSLPPPEAAYIARRIHELQRTDQLERGL